MNKYAFFDVDYTIYNGYSTNDFNLFLVDIGVCPVSIKEKNEELVELYNSGKIDYTEASNRVVALQAEAIKGLTSEKVIELGDEFVSKDAKLFPFVKDLFKLLEEKDFQIYLISAAASPCVEAIARLLETDKYFASELEIKANKYTGEVSQMLNNQEKKHAIHRVMGHLSKNSLKLGFGDSTGDIEMLSSVDHAFVINPHQDQIKQIAKENNWSLVTSDNIISEVRKTLDI